MFKYIFCLSLSFSFLISFSQTTDYPSNYFRSPLDFPLYLSGTFGELRSNHLHSGIDIKTQGVEGQKVYAVADGYVSRIKVSSGGYGNALYITHPNGYVSVYGHLQRYSSQIEKYIRELQYQNESFEVEAYPEKGLLPVKMGEIVAYSGNSGSSGGPHLHFEIREESSQYPVNPLLYKSISIKDTFKPFIVELAVYPVDEQSLINSKNDTAFFLTETNGAIYHLKGNQPVKVSGNISFGIRANDQMNDISNKNGVYQIKLLLDDKLVFELTLDKLSFTTSRYINSLIDYNYFKKSDRRIVRTQQDTNNQLFNYHHVNNNGIIFFSDNLQHQLNFQVSDVNGNMSELKFSVNSSQPIEKKRYISKNEMNSDNKVFFKFNNENKFSKGDVLLTFPENSFYRSFWFELNEKKTDNSRFSDIYEVHNKYTPVQKSFTISIKPRNVSETVKKNLFIAYSPDGKSFSYVGSEWDGEALTANSNVLGIFMVLSDTVAPVILPVNIVNGKNIAGQKSIKLKIDDPKSGIKKYRATLNGKWILMEYDAKNDLLTYNFDDRLKKGENEFKLVVSDMLENETVYKAKLIN